MGSAGSFTFYNAGRFPNDPGGDLYMFTCWNAAHTGCGCHSVYEKDLKANIAALERNGSINRTARKERWDYTVHAWVPLTAPPVPPHHSTKFRDEAFCASFAA